LDFFLVNSSSIKGFGYEALNFFLPNQNILGQIGFNSPQTDNTDLNDDGNVDILDIIFRVNLILSWSHFFNSPKFFPINLSNIRSGNRFGKVK
jgi:hypothetical protein